MPDREAIRKSLQVLKDGMRQQGVWSVAQPAPEHFERMGAFGMNTMAFAQWLRWVFVPNVEASIESDGPWPRSSSVAVQAAREGDTDPAIAALVPALAAFDALFVDPRG